MKDDVKHFFLLAIALTLICSGNTKAQDAISAPVAGAEAYVAGKLPSDAQAALELASKANGLGGTGLEPYYLRTHYQTFDGIGKPDIAGTFELWWAAKDRYRVTFTRAGLSQTTYFTPEGALSAHGAGLLSYGESLILGRVLRPIDVEAADKLSYFGDRVSDGVRSPCFEASGSPDRSGRVYCLDKKEPILRSSEEDGYMAEAGSMATFDHVNIFQHRYVSASVSASEGDHETLSMEQEEVRTLRPSESAALTPPENAKPLFILSSETGAQPTGGMPALVVNHQAIDSHILSKQAPTYPREAKMRQAQATVRISAIVGIDGKLHDLVVISDPDPALSRSALRAVATWRCTPFLMSGKPVEVLTAFAVTFILGD